jgi:general stress protein YciG
LQRHSSFLSSFPFQGLCTASYETDPEFSARGHYAAEQRRIASEGGKASHASGQGHKWTTEEARAAGRKGGLTSRRGPSRPTAEGKAPGKTAK